MVAHASLGAAAQTVAWPQGPSVRTDRRAADGAQLVGPSLIDITVKAPDRLFHELDPSPLAGRNLDQQVESYILPGARELPSKDYALLIHVPGSRMPSASNARALASAIRTHFAERANEQGRKLRALMRDGRQALAVGIAFLFLCGALGRIALRTLPAPFGLFLEEGLWIIGWVANWRPLEIFLYDWRPIRRERGIFDSLSRMAIHFRSADFDLGPVDFGAAPQP